MPKYAKRKLDVTINLGTGEFGENKGSDVTLSGLRVSASYIGYATDVQGALHLRIFGVPLAMIDQLTTIGPIMTQRRNNRITLAAGEEGGSMSTVYEGTIDSAFADFNGAPEVVFNVVALAAAFESVKAVKAQDHPGNVDAALIMKDLADTMGFTFEPNGVSVMLTDRTFSGTAMMQVKECAQAAQINYTVEKGILAIWPRKSYRVGEPVEISPETGMVGYPTFSSTGLVLTTQFNPDIILGRRVNVTSSLTVACGLWNVFSIAHILESETPNGQWFTQVNCTRMENV